MEDMAQPPRKDTAPASAAKRVSLRIRSIDLCSCFIFKESLLLIIQNCTYSVYLYRLFIRNFRYI